MVPVGVWEVRVGEVICHVLPLLLEHPLQLVLLLHLIQALPQPPPLGLLQALLLLLVLCKLLMILMYDLILFLQSPDAVLHPLHLATPCLLEVPPEQLPLRGQLVPPGEDNPLARQLVKLAEEEGLEGRRLFATGVICRVRLKVGVG